MQGHVRTTLREDIPILAKNLRDADVAEIKASSGRTPGEALQDGLDAARIGGSCRTICLPDGEPVGIFGVSAQGQAVGAIWMVATKRFHSLHRQFLRECRGHIASVTNGYKLVYNFTDARNTVHHRWIKWAGFTVIKRHEEFGYEGRPFLEFVLMPESFHV